MIGVASLLVFVLVVTEHSRVVAEQAAAEDHPWRRRTRRQRTGGFSSVDSLGR
jgi:hypothetical protein